MRWYNGSCRLIHRCCKYQLLTTNPNPGLNRNYFTLAEAISRSQPEINVQQMTSNLRMQLIACVVKAGVADVR